MYFGVDYYPEHWPLDWMDEDIDRMVRLGSNVVRIGEFAWHLMESEEENYDFGYFDAVIDKLKEKGLKIIFGTPTATFPAWLAKKHPEILSQDVFGNVRVFGGRRQYCYNSEAYRIRSKKIVTELVKHYADETAIVAWQVDNEFGHEGSDDCYCPTCHKKWQLFLKDTYGDIQTLNETYGTIFWGQTYNDFEEIPMPVPTITTHNPSLKLDWSRFRSKSLNDFAKLQIETIRTYKNESQVITHNLFGGFFDRKYDQTILAENLDVVAYDNYPVWGGLREPISPAHIAMTLDYQYGLKQKPYWIMEQLMGAQGHDVIGYRPRKGQGRLWSWQAMAHGCESLLYFRDRTMNKGQEQYCQGLVDADNVERDCFQEAKQFFKEAKEITSRWTWEECAEVAVLYDYENIQSWQGQVQSEAFNFTEELLRLYEPFYKNNIRVDVISAKKEWQFYKVILLPVQQIVTPALAEKMKAYVANGGILLASYRLGIKDVSNNLFLGEHVPWHLSDLFGIEVHGYESLHLDKKVFLSGEMGSCEGRVWRDLLKVKSEGVQVLLHYKEETFSDYAALTCHAYGKGFAYYLATGLDSAGMTDLVKEMAKMASVKGIQTSEGLEIVTRRRKDDKVDTILMNHTANVIEWQGHFIKPYEVHILSQ